jgi:hypothetical protein
VHFEGKERKKHKHKHKHKKEKKRSEAKESSERGVSVIDDGDNRRVEDKKPENTKAQTTKNEVSIKPQKRMHEMTDRDKSAIEEQRTKRIKTTPLPTVEHLTKLAQYLRLALRNNVQQFVISAYSLSLSLSLSLSPVY